MCLKLSLLPNWLAHLLAQDLTTCRSLQLSLQNLPTWPQHMTLSYLVLSCLILSCLVLSWPCTDQAGKLATQVCWGWLDGWLTEQLMCWLTDCQASYDLNLDALTDDLAQLLQCVHTMVLCIHPDVSLAMYVSYCILSWNELSKWSAS